MKKSKAFSFAVYLRNRSANKKWHQGHAQSPSCHHGHLDKLAPPLEVLGDHQNGAVPRDAHSDPHHGHVATNKTLINSPIAVTKNSWNQPENELMELGGETGEKTPEGGD